MKQISTLLTVQLLLITSLSAQQWVDTLYTFQTYENLVYGSTTDFAGNVRQLAMDISIPVGDTPPDCGRPLLVTVHGGAFFAGDKAAGMSKQMRMDFARRGYTTASVNYRLGMFQTHTERHCNISSMGAEWDCLNMADTSEWHRALYRSIQDVNGAIRYLVNNASDYNIDPQNIFVAGESAGGFIAMGVGFMDDESEAAPTLTGALPNVEPPHSIYENQCIIRYQLDTSTASMDLQRPDLGPYYGTLNYPATQSYQIKGVGSFAGGAFDNIFASHNTVPPALYMFHQPNDLIVPFNYGRAYGGYAHCATQFPFFCQYIINRPFLYGSKGISILIDTMTANGQLAPDYLFERTSNNANCLLQLANPDLQGHNLDSYWQRTKNMAAFFATKIGECVVTNFASPDLNKPPFAIYPNPANGFLRIEIGKLKSVQFELYDLYGKALISHHLNEPTNTIALQGLPAGIYFISLQHQKQSFVQKLIKN